jgi:hypothetical protein
MNILFIGPYRQEDEWGRKSRAILQALQKGDHSITSRPIFLTQSGTYDQYIEKTEFVTLDKYDVLIQFVLQPYVIYDGHVKKRIGIFNTETIPYEVARGHLTKELMMDELWIDSPTIGKGLQNALEHYDPSIKVKSIPPLLDVSNLPSQSGISLTASDPDLKDKFIFYYIGNLLEDKGGFKEAFLAYVTSFTNKDPVALVAASDVPLNQAELDSCLSRYRESIGTFRRIAEQPLFKVIGAADKGFLHTRERVALHYEGNCMVAPNYSIATNSLALEGAMYKSTPIVNKGNACYEWWGEENLWGIDSYEELCLSSQRPTPYRFTAGELWHKPIIKSLREVMKSAYINKFQRDKKIVANTKLRTYFEEASFNI